MVVHRKKTTTHKAVAAATESVAEEAPVAPSRPVVTQVVEVIDEVSGNALDDSVPPEAQDVAPPVDQESNIANFPDEQLEESVTPTVTTEDQESHKEKVEELYSATKETSVMPEISVHKKSSLKPIFIWAIIMLLVAFLAGGVLFALSANTVSLPTFVAPTPTPEPTVEPTPTPEVIDKATLQIEVLNGGGVPGAASKMKKFLEDAGYLVADTGNTDEYTYDTTEIHTTAAKEGALLLLKNDLKDEYALGTTAADLPADSAYDVQIIVGKE